MIKFIFLVYYFTIKIIELFFQHIIHLQMLSLNQSYKILFSSL